MRSHNSTGVLVVVVVLGGGGGGGVEFAYVRTAVHNSKHCYISCSGRIHTAAALQINGAVVVVCFLL